MKRTNGKAIVEMLIEEGVISISDLKEIILENSPHKTKSTNKPISISDMKKIIMEKGLYETKPAGSTKKPKRSPFYSGSSSGCDSDNTRC